MSAPTDRMRTLLDAKWHVITSQVSKALTSEETLPKSPEETLSLGSEAPGTPWHPIPTKLPVTADQLNGTGDWPDIEGWAYTARQELWLHIVTELNSQAKPSTQKLTETLDMSTLELLGDGGNSLIILAGDLPTAKKLRATGKADRLSDLSVLRRKDSALHNIAALAFRTVSGPYLNYEDFELGWDYGDTGQIVLQLGSKVRLMRYKVPNLQDAPRAFVVKLGT